MTDPELSPEQERAVRRALADARHTDPIPAEVAARLDDVLADLGRESDAESSREPTDDKADELAARRRRRRGANLLIAAAAVVVAGIGIGSIVGGVVRPAGHDAQTSSDSGGFTGQSDESQRNQAEAPAPTAENAEPPAATSAQGHPVIRADHFDQDVRTVVGLWSARTALDGPQPADGQDAQGDGDDSLLGEQPPFPDCGVVPAAGEALIGVLWEGRTANLLVGVPTEGTRTVSLHLCATGELVRRTSVPALP